MDSFNEVAKMPSLKDLLNRIQSGKDISLATALSILLLIASGPVALFGFNNLIRVSISLAEHEIEARLFRVFASNGGSDVLLSSTLLIEVKKLFKHSTFSSSEKQ
ncbi:MAG: hypothetical protein N0E48_12195 [Candidatus Thiodiazotropha endolucinida]|nr:hypothetical protein [Candidatus Thiodiazotropha endolucinida]